MLLVHFEFEEKGDQQIWLYNQLLKLLLVLNENCSSFFILLGVAWHHYLRESRIPMCEIPFLQHYKILHSSGRHCRLTLMTDAEPMLTMLFERWRYTVKNVIFCTECPRTLYSFTIMLLNYCAHRVIFSMSVTVAMTLLKMPRWPQLVSQLQPYEHIFCAVDILVNITLPKYPLKKILGEILKISPVELTNPITCSLHEVV